MTQKKNKVQNLTALSLKIIKEKAGNITNYRMSKVTGFSIQLIDSWGKGADMSYSKFIKLVLDFDLDFSDIWEEVMKQNNLNNNKNGGA